MCLTILLYVSASCCVCFTTMTSFLALFIVCMCVCAHDLLYSQSYFEIPSWQLPGIVTLISLSFSGSGRSIVCCIQTLLGAPAPGNFNTLPETQTEWISKCLPKLNFLWWRRKSLQTSRNNMKESHCCPPLAPEYWRISETFGHKRFPYVPQQSEV